MYLPTGDLVAGAARRILVSPQPLVRHHTPMIGQTAAPRSAAIPDARSATSAAVRGRAVTSLARHAVISSAAAGGRSGERVGCEARMERTSKSGSVLRRSP